MIELIFAIIMLLCILGFRKMRASDLVGTILSTIFGIMLIISIWLCAQVLTEGQFFKDGIVNTEAIKEAIPGIISVVISIVVLVLNQHVVGWIEKGINFISDKANSKIVERLIVLILSCVQGCICVFVITALIVWTVNMTSLDGLMKLVQESEFVQQISVYAELFLKKYLLLK